MKEICRLIKNIINLILVIGCIYGEIRLYMYLHPEGFLISILYFISSIILISVVDGITKTIFSRSYINEEGKEPNEKESVIVETKLSK